MWHKAPANEIVNDALGVELNMSNAEQGQINVLGINRHPAVSRAFAAHHMGSAHHLDQDVAWQYVWTCGDCSCSSRNAISEGDPVGGVRAQQCRPMAQVEPLDHGVPHARLARWRRCSAQKPEEAFTSGSNET